MQKELTQCNYLYSKAYVELTLISNYIIIRFRHIL